MKLLFRLLTLLFFTLTTLSANAQAPILTADAAILIDARTGQVLYEKNADKREYPASMTKMMTCILALEKGNPLKTIAVSANAANVESTELCGGEWIRLGDLTYQMMLISDNGAATAIAEAIGGNVNHFTSMMNEKARAIGAVGTHFVNANGMPDEDHYSTARDMAKIAQYGLRKIFPARIPIISSSPMTVPSASRQATPAPRKAALPQPPQGMAGPSSPSSCTPAGTAASRKPPRFWITDLK